MKCKICGKNAETEYCFLHKKRKPLAIALRKKPDNLEEKHRNISERNELFLQIWTNRSHKSEVSGDYLGNEPLSMFFHHILAKEKYPQAAFDEENIILLTLQEHDQVEMDMYRYEEVNNRREKLLIKYNLK
jgi:hypothetical protein